MSDDISNVKASDYIFNVEADINWIRKEPNLALAIPIYSQGECGCSWAMATATCLSYLKYLYYEADDCTFSPQDILDMKADEGPRLRVHNCEALGNWTDGPAARKAIIKALSQYPLVANLAVTKSFEMLKGTKAEEVWEPSPTEKEVGLQYVVVVGVSIALDYFIIHNSMSKNWGFGGYAKVRCSQLREFTLPVLPFTIGQDANVVARTTSSTLASTSAFS